MIIIYNNNNNNNTSNNNNNNDNDDNNNNHHHNHNNHNKRNHNNKNNNINEHAYASQLRSYTHLRAIWYSKTAAFWDQLPASLVGVLHLSTIAHLRPPRVSFRLRVI
jgi:hypothetical protein